jgi:hypothetical protein
MEGESVSTGSSLLLLGRSDKPSVIAYLPPKYGKYARKGQKAVVKLPKLFPRLRSEKVAPAGQ